VEPNKKHIALWVAALRSGVYTQGKGYLKNVKKHVTYCCLGVVCELAKTNGINVTERAYDGANYADDDSSSPFSFNGSVYLMPTEVADWLGLSRNPEMMRELPSGVVEEHSATFWNDETTLSFTEIADLIEFTYLKA